MQGHAFVFEFSQVLQVYEATCIDSARLAFNLIYALYILIRSNLLILLFRSNMFDYVWARDVDNS